MDMKKLKGKIFVGLSDKGGLKVGNEDFSFVIPNGSGDGLTKAAFVDDYSFDLSGFYFFTDIQGKFNIYDYDCGDKVLKTIEGRFGIFYGEGFVIFERWD